LMRLISMNPKFDERYKSSFTFLLEKTEKSAETCRKAVGVNRETLFTRRKQTVGRRILSVGHRKPIVPDALSVGTNREPIAPASLSADFHRR